MQFLTGETGQLILKEIAIPTLRSLNLEKKYNKNILYDWRILPSFIEEGVLNPWTSKIMEWSSQLYTISDIINSKALSEVQIRSELNKQHSKFNETLDD